MKQCLFILVAITFNQTCMGMNDENEESAYRTASQSYKEIIEKFGSKLILNKFFPDKNKPIDHKLLNADVYNVLTTYCKTAHPSLNINNECASKLAKKIEADKEIVPEAKNFVLFFFNEYENYQVNFQSHNNEPLQST